MGMLWKIGVGRPILWALGLITLGAICFYCADQDTSTARDEKTTTADVYRSYHTRSDASGNRAGSFVCSYTFTVDGKLYLGSGCPSAGTDISVKDQLWERVGGTQRFGATVYYKPDDPSTNSLNEFASRSKWENRGGVALLCLGIILLVYSLLGTLLGNNQATVDAGKGTAQVQPAPSVDVSNVSDQKFLEDLDKVLRNQEGPDRPHNE